MIVFNISPGTAAGESIDICLPSASDFSYKLINECSAVITSELMSCSSMLVTREHGKKSNYQDLNYRIIPNHSNSTSIGLKYLRATDHFQEK